MKVKSMPSFTYDRVADALYIKLSDKKIKESIEIGEEIIVDYSEDSSVVGIEILNYSKRKIDLNELILMSDDEIVASLVSVSIK